MTGRRATPALAGMLVLAAATGARAEGSADMLVGAPLTPGEIDQARLFCQAAILRQSTQRDPEITCDCFQLQWERRTNRLHRLALAISLAPDSAQARSAVWTIGQAQQGLHETKLETLSAEFRAAAQAAMAGCSR